MPPEQTRQQAIRDKAVERYRQEESDLYVEEDDARKLVQELRIHQIELELQNEELRQTQQRLTEAAEQYSDLYDFAPVGYLTLDKNAVIRRLNLTAADMLGVTRDRLTQKPLITRIPAAHHSILNTHIRAVLAGHAPPPCELKLQRPDGGQLWVTLSNRLDGSSKEERLCRATLTDVTELKKAEQALRESEATLRGVLQSAPSGIGMIVNRTFVWTNERLAQMTGYSQEELNGAPARMLYESQAEYDRVGQVKYADIHRTGSGSVETRWRRKDGCVIDVMLNSTALERSRLEAGVVFTALDITERNKALAALKESEARYRLLADNTVDCIWLTDMALRFEYVNPAIFPMLGYRPHEWRGTRLDEHCPAADVERFKALIEQEVARGGSAAGVTLETTLTHKNGRRIAVEISGKVLFNQYQEATGLRGVTRNITERRKAEGEIRKFKMLAENATYGVAIADLTGEITYANAAFANMHGYRTEELIGTSLSVLQPEGQWDLIQAIDTGVRSPEAFGPKEVHHKRKDGSEFSVLLNCSLVHDDTGKELFLAVTANDITDLKSLEAQLLQAQKMEAIGQLAGGVAHDFNNLLTVIINRADLIEDALPPFSSYRDDIKEIIDASMRGAALTRQLLAFSSRQYLTIKRLDINQVIRSVEKMLKRLIGEDIRLHIRLAEQACPTLADPGQLEQVILNLAVNARDAMPNGGILTIETRHVDIKPDDLDATLNPDRPRPGQYAAMCITDTGVGMDKAIQAKIFDPFFTTKDVGQGTGLGLSTVYGIVKQHKGFIRVYSEPGKGTTFRVFLPLHEQETTEHERVPSAAAPSQGNETILLVEDEPAVRRVSARMLRNLGYQVLEAENGKKALEMIREHGEQIALLLTDVVMPELDGKQLVEQAVVLKPDIKVIFTSGYPEAHLKLRNAWVTDHLLLQKPFLSSELASSIRKVLDED